MLKTAKAWAAIAMVTLGALLVVRGAVAADNPAAKQFQTGLAYERLGRYEEAYTALQLAFALNQDDALIAVALGIVACRLGRWEVAQRALEQSVAADSDSVTSYFHLALVYEKNGVTERALDAWHRFASHARRSA